MRGGLGTSTTLTPDDAEAILREVPSVGALSPGVNASVPLVAGNQNWTTRAEGAAASYPEVRARSVASGNCGVVGSRVGAGTARYHRSGECGDDQRAEDTQAARRLPAGCGTDLRTKRIIGSHGLRA